MTATGLKPTTTWFLNEHSTSLAKWLSVRLWTKWLWVRGQLQSLKLCCPNAQKLVCAKIGSGKVFKVYTIISKQNLFRIIVHYHLVFIISVLYLWTDTNFFSSFPCFTATEQDNPCWHLNSENRAKVRLLWKVSK